MTEEQFDQILDGLAECEIDTFVEFINFLLEDLDNEPES